MLDTELSPSEFATLSAREGSTSDPQARPSSELVLPCRRPGVVILLIWAVDDTLNPGFSVGFLT